MGSKKSTQESHSTTQTDMTNDQYAHQERFTDPQKKQAAWDLVNKATDQYNQLNGLSKQLLNNYYSGKSLGDDSWFKQGWEQQSSFDQNPLKKIYMADVDPNNDQGWVKAMNDIEGVSKYDYGKYINQAYQNGIGTGMGGSSGHQSALYNGLARLQAENAANRGNLYMQQRQNNVNNVQNAGNLMNNINQGLTNAGLQGWQTSQQGYSTMLNGLGMVDNSLKTLGNAIEMNADPTMTTRQHQYGTSTTDATNTTKSSSGFGDIIGSAAGLFTPIKWFG